MAEDEESSVSHSPNNEQDIKPFNQDNKSLLVLTLDSMTNATQVIYIKPIGRLKNKKKKCFLFNLIKTIFLYLAKL